jgi:dihydrodipicolinate synthase/N-acetylneuraminate lyase
MSAEERMTLLDALVAAGVDPARMMPGTGCCSISETVELTAHAVKHGCAGVLMLPPFYYKNVSEEGLYRYFSEVVQRVGDPRLKIYLYHIPPVAVVGITPKLVERLLQAYPTAIAGMKDSSGDWNNTKTFLDAFAETARAPRAFDVFVGSESFLLANMRNGGVGTISATANVNPAAIHELYADYNRQNCSGVCVKRRANRKALGTSASTTDLTNAPGAVKRGTRGVRAEVVALNDRSLETGDCDLRKRPGMGQGAATAGRAHNRAGTQAGCRTRKNRVQHQAS